jgi:hypothetical protein
MPRCPIGLFQVIVCVGIVYIPKSHLLLNVLHIHNALIVSVLMPHNPFYLAWTDLSTQHLPDKVFSIIRFHHEKGHRVTYLQPLQNAYLLVQLIIGIHRI